MARYIGIAFATLTFLALNIHADISDYKKENMLPGDAKEVLEKPDQFELLSLDPYKTDKEQGFHNHPVLGKTTIKGEKDRKKIVSALLKGIADNKGEVGKCFEPRHGIRVKHADKTVDFVICFHCKHIHVYVGDKKTNLRTTGSPQTVFDGILKAAEVPLAPKD
jgi:hypothetical protein